MIEKITPEHILGLDGLPATIMPDNSKLMRKINELVDTVNKLQSLETKKVEAADRFAVQRNWVGKLCKFWDIVDNDFQYDILTKIDEENTFCPYIADGVHYNCCEPVSEDLIYKGK